MAFNGQKFAAMVFDDRAQAASIGLLQELRRLQDRYPPPKQGDAAVSEGSLAGLPSADGNCCNYPIN